MNETAGRIFDHVQGPDVETWQVGMERLQSWIHPPEGRPFRRPFAVCLNLDREISLCLTPEERDPPAHRLVEMVLRQGVLAWGSRPARIQTEQPAVAAALREILSGEDIVVEIQPELPRLRRSLASNAFQLEPEDAEPTPSLLAGRGVTMAQIAAFSRAASEFLAREPWRLLVAQDLIRVESPAVGPALRYISLSRSFGKVVLRFFMDPEDLDLFLDGELSEELWAIFFQPVWDAPAADADLWERHGLPRFGEEELIAIPMFLLPDEEGIAERPDARQLAFFEGLLKTLASSTESDMDSGLWTKEVETHLGPVRFSLSIPRLLEVAATGEAPAPELGPEEQVRRLLDAAQEWGGRCQVLLARRALEIQPDCAEAYLLLAEMASTPERELELYDRARTFAEQALGPEALAAEGGLDWEETQSLVYLDARQEMARCLHALRRLEEAASHLEDLLRLDPTDSIVRNDLAALYIELGREADALALFEARGTDRLPGGAFNRALLFFRREGDSSEARRALRAALLMNSSVPDSLLPRNHRDQREISFGERQIAAQIYASSARHLWKATPGALTWLARSLQGSEAPRPAALHPALALGRTKKKRKQKRRKGKKRR